MKESIVFSRKILIFLLSLLATAALFTGCSDSDDEPSIPALSVSENDVSVDQAGGSFTISVTSNRPWTVSTTSDWLAFSQTEGEASDSPVTVTVSFLSNSSSDRKAYFNVKTAFDYRTVTVSQTGPGGVDPTQSATGKGTKDDPYNVIAAIEAVSDLTWTSNDSYETTGEVYVSGKISRIVDNGTFTAGGSYGNATFYISEDGKAENEFYVFRTLYLGNKKYKSGQTDIKTGDEVVICGKLMNYRGNTPETDANKSYLYSLNGSTGDGSQEGGGDDASEYENAKSATVAAFIEAADKNTYFKLSGKVSGFNPNYCSFDLTDESGKIYVYSVSNKDDWSSKITEGGTVTLAGKYDFYEAKQQHEVVQAWILSFEAAESGQTEEARKVTVSEFLSAEDSKTQPYELTGKVSGIKSDVYGNFDLTDGTGTVYVYGLVSKDLGGYSPNRANDKSFASIGIKEGDEITIVGFRETYTDKEGNKTDEVVGAYYVSGAQGGGDSGQEEISGGTVVFSSLNIKNGTQYNGSGDDKTVVNAEDFSVSFGKGNNDGKYYDTGRAVRTYGNGYIRVDSKGKTITRIVYTFEKTTSSENPTYPTDGAYTLDTGKLSLDGGTVTWTGSAKSVSLTRPNGNGHWRLQKIEVDFED